jgi:hypothetical protein
MGKRYSAYWRSWKNCSVEPALWQSPVKIEFGGALGKSGKRTADHTEEMKSFGSKRNGSFGKLKISRKKTNSPRAAKGTQELRKPPRLLTLMFGSSHLVATGCAAGENAWATSLDRFGLWGALGLHERRGIPTSVLER